VTDAQCRSAAELFLSRRIFVVSRAYEVNCLNIYIIDFILIIQVADIYRFLIDTHLEK